jgi:hypothetical protein
MQVQWGGGGTTPTGLQREATADDIFIGNSTNSTNLKYKLLVQTNLLPATRSPRIISFTEDYHCLVRY